MQFTSTVVRKHGQFGAGLRSNERHEARKKKAHWPLCSPEPILTPLFGSIACITERRVKGSKMGSFSGAQEKRKTHGTQSRVKGNQKNDN